MPDQSPTNAPAHGCVPGSLVPTGSRESGAPMSWLRPRIAPRRPRQFTLRLDELDARTLPAVTASFVPATGLLTVFGDDLANTITVGRNATGRILVNGGAVAV